MLTYQHSHSDGAPGSARKTMDTKIRTSLSQLKVKALKATKKRKVISPKELSDKIMIPAPAHTEEFPGLEDIEGPTPFPDKHLFDSESCCQQMWHFSFGGHHRATPSE
jgi:hypothetical protein